MSKRVVKVYEPPLAVDLTGFSVSGQNKDPKPAGICMSGGQLTFVYCTTGTSPAGGNCAPTGALPELGYCRAGNNAVEGCSSGGIHS